MRHISYKELNSKSYKVYLTTKIKFTKRQLVGNTLTPIQKERALNKITKMYNELKSLQGQ